MALAENRTRGASGAASAAHVAAERPSGRGPRWRRRPHHAGDRQQLRAHADLRLGVYARHNRAEPDVPRRLRRHGQPRANDDRRFRRLHRRDPRRQRHAWRNGLALVARGSGGFDPRDDCRRHHWRARGAHRGHLHDHDHARDRRGVLLFHQRELRDLQRPHRHRRRSDASLSGRRLARLDHPSTISPSASPSCAGSRSPMSRGRPSGSLCRACATTPGGWRRWASTSMRIASRPMCSRRSSPRSAASCWSGAMARSRPAPSASRRRSTSSSSRSSAASAIRSARSSAP